MATLTIHNIPDDLLEKLEKSAHGNGHSVEEEAMQVFFLHGSLGTSANVRLSCSVSVRTDAKWQKKESGLQMKK